MDENNSFLQPEYFAKSLRHENWIPDHLLAEGKVRMNKLIDGVYILECVA